MKRKSRDVFSSTAASIIARGIESRRNHGIEGNTFDLVDLGDWFSASPTMVIWLSVRKPSDVR